MKIELIHNWRKFHQMWSVRLMTIGTVLATWFLAAPDAAISIWLSMPSELKDALPPELVKMIPVFILVAGTFARAVKQNKLSEGDENGKG